jgi:hypothetical protein
MTEEKLQVVRPDGLVNQSGEPGYDEYAKQDPPSHRIIENMHRGPAIIVCLGTRTVQDDVTAGQQVLTRAAKRFRHFAEEPLKTVGRLPESAGTLPCNCRAEAAAPWFPLPNT